MDERIDPVFTGGILELVIRARWRGVAALEAE